MKLTIALGAGVAIACLLPAHVAAQTGPPDRFAFAPASKLREQAQQFDTDARRVCGPKEKQAALLADDVKGWDASLAREQPETDGARELCLCNARTDDDAKRRAIQQINDGLAKGDLNPNVYRSTAVPPPATDEQLAQAPEFRECLTQRTQQNANEGQRLEYLRHGREEAQRKATAAKDAAEKCSGDVERRTAERRQLAPTRPLDEIAAIPEPYRLPEEQARVAQAEAERRARIAEHRADPKFARPTLSAAICAFQAMRKDAADEIAEEKKYARQGGGVVDVSKIYALQQRMRALDARIADERGAMRAAHLAPLGCGVKLVKSIAACLGPDHDGCAEMLDYEEIAPSMIVDD